MANIFTFLYVLENLEDCNNELINVEEIFKNNNSTISEISMMLDACEVNVKTDLVRNIIEKAGIS